MSDFSIGRAGDLGSAHDAQEARLKQAAAQFETLFINQLLKQNEAFGSQEASVFGSSPAERNYQELLNNALSEHAAGGLGVADAILDQLRVHKDIGASAAPTISTESEG